MRPEDVPRFLFDEIRQKFTEGRPVELENFENWEVIHLEKSETWIGYHESRSEGSELAIIYVHPVLDRRVVLAGIEGSEKRLKIVLDNATIGCDFPAYAMVGYLIMRLTQLKHPKAFGEPESERSR